MQTHTHTHTHTHIHMHARTQQKGRIQISNCAVVKTDLTVAGANCSPLLLPAPDLRVTEARLALEKTRPGGSEGAPP